MESTIQTPSGHSSAAATATKTDKNTQQTLIEVRDLKVEFNIRGGLIKAVDGLTFDIKRGQTVGIIGESGCGKSVTARAILRMVNKPGRVASGQVLYYRPNKFGVDKTGEPEVVDITQLDPDGETIRKIRGGEIAMIFQEPMSSLTPVYTTGTHIGEAVSLHRMLPLKKLGDQMAQKIMDYRHVTKEEAREIAIQMLKRVGLPKPEERVDSYPHQLSGGQRQRVMIAVALSTEPAMLIADEPTTALDVSIEAQILDIMTDLQQTSNMAIMFITHNLGVIASMANEIVVMYMGKAVERASVEELFYNPKHPYTQALLRSVPKLGRKGGDRNARLATIEGMVPDPLHLPTGCVFHPRCPAFMPGKCDKVTPTWTKVAENHYASCLLYEEGK